MPSSLTPDKRGVAPTPIDEEWLCTAPVTPQPSATVTLALHAAIPHLLDAGPATLAAAGLDDLDGFVYGLLEAVYPRRPDGTQLLDTATSGGDVAVHRPGR